MKEFRILINTTYICVSVQYYRVCICEFTLYMYKMQPGGSLSSVDRSPGSPRRCLCVFHLLTPPDHGGLGPVDHLELLVLSWGQHVYSTKTLACAAV